MANGLRVTTYANGRLWFVLGTRRGRYLLAQAEPSAHVDLWPRRRRWGVSWLGMTILLASA